MVGQCAHETANIDLHLYVVHDLGHDLCQANGTQANDTQQNISPFS